MVVCIAFSDADGNLANLSLLRSTLPFFVLPQHPVTPKIGPGRKMRLLFRFCAAEMPRFRGIYTTVSYLGNASAS